MTLCAYGNLLLRSGHVLLTHICCSHTLRVGALSRTSMLTLTAKKTLSEGAVVHSRVGNTHTGAYSHRGFLTFTSCVSGMPLYGQNDQYLRHVLSQAFFQTFPPSRNWRHKAEGWELMRLCYSYIFSLNVAHLN